MGDKNDTVYIVTSHTDHFNPLPHTVMIRCTNVHVCLYITTIPYWDGVWC